MSISGLSNTPQIQDVLNKISEMRSRAAPALQAPQDLKPHAKAGVGGVTDTSGVSFIDALKNSIDGVNKDQNAVTELSKAYDLGNPNVDLTDVMVAVQKANVSFQSAVQVRNRLVSAYHDMMNMQI